MEGERPESMIGRGSDYRKMVPPEIEANLARDLPKENTYRMLYFQRFRLGPLSWAWTLYVQRTAPEG